jgi:hypothetical protein
VHSGCELNAVRSLEVESSFDVSCLFGDSLLEGKQANVVIIEENISVLGGDFVISGL